MRVERRGVVEIALVLIDAIAIVGTTITVLTHAAAKAGLGWTRLLGYEFIRGVQVGLARLVTHKLLDTFFRLAAAIAMLAAAATVQVGRPIARARLVKHIGHVEVRLALFF